MRDGYKVNPFHEFNSYTQRALREDVTALRAANPDLEIRCCGDQPALNAASAAFCYEIGMDSVSVPSAPQTMANAMAGMGQALDKPALKPTPKTSFGPSLG